jgi:hypothetical protein
VGIDGDRRFAEGRVEHDVGGLAADPGEGFEPPWRSSNCRARPMTFFAFVRYRPMVLMYSASRSSPRRAMAAGVGAALNSVRVARFTLLSVA